MHQFEFTELFNDWVNERDSFPTALSPYSSELQEFVEYCLAMYHRDPGPEDIIPESVTEEGVIREVRTIPKFRKDTPAFEGGQTAEPRYEIHE